MVKHFSRRLLFFFRIFLGEKLPSGSLRILITVFSLSFVGYTVFVNSNELAKLNLNSSHIFWLMIATIISLFSLIINGFAWRSLLFWLGYRANDLNLISLYLRSNLLKYLPGGVWHFVERLRVVGAKVGSGRALASVLLEPLLMSSAALLWVVIGDTNNGLYLLCLLPSICFLPKIREPLLCKLERLKLKQLEGFLPKGFLSAKYNSIGNQRSAYPFFPMALEMLFVLLRFGGFWCCLKAFSVEDQISLGQWMAAFSLAWTAGLVVPAAPGGIGVFETIFFLIIEIEETSALLIAAILCYRFVVTIADVLAAILPFFKRKLEKKDVSLSLDR